MYNASEADVDRVEFDTLRRLEAQLTQELSSIPGMPSRPFVFGGLTYPAKDMANLCIRAIDGLLPLLESLAHQVPDSGVLSKLNTYKESLQPLYEACSSGVMKIKELGNGYTESLQNATTTTTDYDAASILRKVLEYLGSVSKFSDFFNQLLEGVDSLHDLIAQNDLLENDITKFRSWLCSRLEIFHGFVQLSESSDT